MQVVANRNCFYVCTKLEPLNESAERERDLQISLVWLLSKGRIICITTPSLQPPAHVIYANRRQSVPSTAQTSCAGRLIVE